MALHDENVVWHAHAVTREDREVLHGHKGAVVWFTGLSGSGKSTVAGALEEVRHRMGGSLAPINISGPPRLRRKSYSLVCL